jgi:cytochrome c oxidase assembly protein subunit 15
MGTPWLHRYAILLAVCTSVLLMAGALVTSNHAGLSVPDWPLSYGKVMPRMTGGVLFEHGHRMVGTTVGLLTIGLLIGILRVERRTWMRKLGWVALAWVSTVGLLGGLTVKLLTPPPVSITHTCLAQLFFALTVTIAVFTSRSWHQGPEMVDDQGAPPLRTLAILTPILVLTQIALGAGFRHGAITILPHVIGAIVISLAVLMISVFALLQFPTHPTLRPAAKTLLIVTSIQIFFGLGAYFMKASTAESSPATIGITVAHVVTGALTLASSIVLAIQIRRNVRSVALQPAGSPQAAVQS